MPLDEQHRKCEQVDLADGRCLTVTRVLDQRTGATWVKLTAVEDDGTPPQSIEIPSRSVTELVRSLLDMLKP